MPPFTPQTVSSPTDFAGLVNLLLSLIQSIIPVLLAVLFAIVIWKVIDAWVINGGDANKREEGKQFVTTAILVFVLMLVTWGVVALLRTAVFG